MNLTVFTLISGIASIISLIIQLSDLFPAHRELRKSAFILIVGIFIGTLIGSLHASSIKIDIGINSFSLLVGTILFIIAILCFAGAITNDVSKRANLLSAAGVGVPVLLIVLLFGSLIMAGSEINNNMTIDECLFLADKNVEISNIDRAIHYLEEVHRRLSSNDSRNSIIEQRIEYLKGEQFNKK